MFKSTVLFLGLVVVATRAGPSDPEPRDDEIWLRRHQGYLNNTLANPQIPILFFGDSVTDGWDREDYGKRIFDQLYAPLGVVEYGIGGEQIQNILWRIIEGEVQGLTPKLVVLMIGTNNLWAYNNTEIVHGIETLVGKFRDLIPTANILLLGILPRHGPNDREDFFDRITDINIQIASLHNGSTIYFLDMFASFVEVWGTVPESLFYDGIHLAEGGFQKWANTMGPLFNQLIA